MIGRIPQSVIDEILDRVSIVDIVGRKVKLQRAGREFKGLSPRTGERSPSLFVSPQKRMFFDFSAGRSGNAITWMMEEHGMPFMDALETLADEAGVKLPKQTPERSIEQETVYRGARAALDLAAGWFASQLGSSALAQHYLADRDVEPDTARVWGIGYAPDSWDGLLRFLRAGGLSLEAIKGSGLIVHGEDIERPHDRFRGRLMIPIKDPKGKVLSFGGRVLGAGEPKWINGQETATYRKGQVLFGLDQATQAIRATGVAVIGEGYLDTIRPHQAGFCNIVSVSGTALQEVQLYALWRLAPLVIVCLDADKAGERAADKALETALPMVAGDRRLAFARLPAGHDPDKVIANAGRAGLQKAVDGATTLADAIWDTALKRGDGSTESRALIATEAKRLANLIGDDETRRQFLSEMDRRSRSQGRREAPGAALPPSGVANPREAAIALGAALWPSYVDAADERLGSVFLGSPLAARVRDTVLTGKFEGERADRAMAELRSHIPRPIPKFIDHECVADWLTSLALQERQQKRKGSRR